MGQEGALPFQPVPPLLLPVSAVSVVLRSAQLRRPRDAALRPLLHRERRYWASPRRELELRAFVRAREPRV
jgi:predicted lipid carrier protein YhbT